MGSGGDVGEEPYDLLVDGPHATPDADLTRLELHGWGYRWIRLARSDRA